MQFVRGRPMRGFADAAALVPRMAAASRLEAVSGYSSSSSSGGNA